jgi:hypothetical protein
MDVEGTVMNGVGKRGNLRLVIFPLVWYSLGVKKRDFLAPKRGSKNRAKRAPPKVPNQTENYYLR